MAELKQEKQLKWYEAKSTAQNLTGSSGECVLNTYYNYQLSNT